MTGGVASRSLINRDQNSRPCPQFARACSLHWIVPYAKRYFSEVGAERENGSLLVVYQPPRARSQRLVPLAVLTMHSGTSGIKSIEAGDGYAP